VTIECPQLPRPSNRHSSTVRSQRSIPTALHILQALCPLKPPLFFIHHPFSSNLQRKCRTAPSSFHVAHHLARMTCEATSPSRRTSPLTTGGLLIRVLRGAPRRRTWRRRMRTRTPPLPSPPMTLTLTPTLPRLHPSEQGEHMFRLK
jgi:hypothetical protein